MEENQKLLQEGGRPSTSRVVQSFENKSQNDINYLKRQIKTLEEKLRRQNVAEKPSESFKSKVNHFCFII
jgi:hypothetical protein